MQSDWNMGGIVGGAAIGGAGFAVGGGLLRKTGGLSGIADKYVMKPIMSNRYQSAAKSFTKARKLKNTGAAAADIKAARDAGAESVKSVKSWADNRKWLGKNKVAINRYGGWALAGIGAVSAGSIGNSMIRSNRGYRR